MFNFRGVSPAALWPDRLPQEGTGTHEEQQVTHDSWELTDVAWDPFLVVRRHGAAAGGAP